MIPLEDKLRAAIHATAEEIPANPPPLRLGSPGPSPRRRPWFRPAASRFRPGRRGWNPWLAPLAAAVLVVAVVLGSLAVTRSGSGTATPSTPSTPPGLAGLPPYYVAVVTLSAAPGQSGSVRSAAQVRSTATGAVLATIAAPKPYVGFVAVTAAADDRTFVLDAQGAGFSIDRLRQLQSQHPGSVEYGSPFRLFVLHIDPDPKTPKSPETHGSGVSLRALPASFVPAGQGIGNMALSPDGTSLAAASSVGSEDGYDMRLTVFNLVTGTRRIWGFDSAGEIYMPAAMLGGLSWTADGQHIAFTGPGASAGSSVLRLLDTTDPGPNALAASKPIPTPAAVTNTDEGWTTAIITPDGRTAVFATAVTTRDGQEMLVRRRILKVSVATGQVTALLGTPKSLAGKPLDFELILYSNGTGSVLVVSYAQPGTSAWILRGDTYTPIPWSPHTITAAW